MRISDWSSDVCSSDLAARILQDQLQLFVNFEEPAQGASAPIGLADAPAEAEAESGQINRYLLKKVDELELSVRSANCLKNDHTIYLGTLVQTNEDEMLPTPNFGRKSLERYKEVIYGLGMRAGMGFPGRLPTK